MVHYAAGVVDSPVLGGWRAGLGMGGRGLVQDETLGLNCAW